MITEINVSGTVQGVGFRYATKKKADELDLKGWVENNDDGTVLIQVSGNDEKVKKLLSAIKNNLTPYSHVDHIDITTLSNEKSFYGFTIK